MSIESQGYKFEVLEYVVNQCIDRLLPSSSEDALSVILYQSNEVVWRVATEIYTQSGHQVDFVFIRDILKLRVEPLQNRIAEEERIRIEQEKIKAELEAQRLAKIAEEALIQKQREKEKQRKLQELREEYPYIEIKSYQEFDIFGRIKNIIVEELEEDETSITLDYIPVQINFNWSYFGSSSGNSNEDNYLNLCEFIMAIEEEFDIEIPDEESESFFGCNIEWLINFIVLKLN